MSLGHTDVDGTEEPLHDAPVFLHAVDRPPATDLSQLRFELARLRDLQVQKADLEERLRTLSREINDSQHKTLPDLFDACGIREVAIPATGNLPALHAKVTPFYAANIAAGWPDERRNIAFSKLTELGGGDLIKCEVITSFGRAERDDAHALAQYIAHVYDQIARVGEAVAHQTLAAWLRERGERGELPSTQDLEILGAIVGRVVKVKETTE